jgi:hypothetical protein
MRFFELKDDVLVPNRWHIGEITMNTGAEPRLRAGLPFSGEALSAKIDQPGVELDFSLTSFAVPVVRVYLAEVIATIAGLDVQRIPLKLPGYNSFEVLNALRVVDCVDEHRSQFTKWTNKDHRADLTGQSRMITKLKLLVDQIPDEARFFRLNGWLVALIVSEPLKMAMERVGCFGARFVEVT